MRYVKIERDNKMFLSENEFFNKYGNEYKSMLEEITFYVNNPDILKQNVAKLKKKQLMVYQLLQLMILLIN